MKVKLRARFLGASLLLVLISLPFLFNSTSRSADAISQSAARSMALHFDGLPAAQIRSFLKEEGQQKDFVIEKVDQKPASAHPQDAQFRDAEGQRYQIHHRPFSFWEIARYLGPHFLIFLIFMIVLSLLLTRYLYRSSLRPFRSMANYLASLTRGDYSAEAPPVEEEEALTDLLGTPEDRRLFVDQLREIRENENMRRQFTANISHELKSPLTSIIGYAEMLEGGKVEPEQSKAFAGIIHREGARLLSIIDQVIQLSKFDTGMAYMNHLEECNLTEILGNELSARTAYAKEHGVTLSAKVLVMPQKEGGADGEPSQPDWVDLAPGAEEPAIYLKGNRRMIEDIVDNLVSNAIKYSRDHDARARIKLIEDEDWVHLSIKDNGIGIGAEDRDRVFERFYVVNAARTKTDKDGTGLGLSLVKHSVAVHHGWIKLESGLGQGSKFTIGLPKDPAAHQTDSRSEGNIQIIGKEDRK